MHISKTNKRAITAWGLLNREIIEIWLFGSRARGDHRPDSDIYLAIVTAGETLAERLACWLCGEWREGPKLSHQVHLHWYDLDAETKAVKPGVERDGFLLFRRNDPSRPRRRSG